MLRIYCLYVFYHKSTFVNNLSYKLKCKWAIFLRQGFKTVGFFFFTMDLKKKRDIVCWNESFLYEVWDPKAITNLPLVYVSDWTLERRNLAVVENLICVCWSVPGAPWMETFLKFLAVVEVPPRRPEKWKAGRSPGSKRRINRPISLIGCARLCPS